MHVGQAQAMFEYCLAEALAQQREQPLTDKQIPAANYPDGEDSSPTITAPDFELITFARAIEAAHGIE